MPITTAASDNIDKTINKMYHDQRKEDNIHSKNSSYSQLKVQNEIRHTLISTKQINNNLFFYFTVKIKHKLKIQRQISLMDQSANNIARGQQNLKKSFC